MKIIINSEKKFFLLIFLVLFLFSFYQFYDQHWTSILDQDPIIIYNSLLLASGFEQEYRDHPAYTTFLILGGIFKFLSLFLSKFTLFEILNSNSIDQDFQKLFYIARLLNTLYIYLSALFIFKILKEFNVKTSISLIGAILFLIHLSTFEVLYLLRSEIVSILFFLIAFYNFLRFINTNNIFYIVFCGFFLCFSILAKIQVIFLIFIFLVIIPYLINYLNYNNEKLYDILNQHSITKSKIIIYFFIAFFVFYQTFIGIIFLKETNNSIFFLNNNLDFYFFIFFLVFYKLYLLVLTKYKQFNTKIITLSLSLILIGFILAVIFIFILDILKIIPIHKSIFFRIMNPLEFMNTYTIKSRIELVNIFVTLKDFFLIGFYDLSYDLNIYYDHKILGIKSRVFFRSIYIVVLLTLILLSLRKINNTNLNGLSLFFFSGITIYFLILNIRETHGYNIYISCIFFILFSLILNFLSKKKLKFFLFLTLIVISLENYSFSNIHKNSFKREPRVYDICINTNPVKWKNSVNYFYNQAFSSPFILVDDINWWFNEYMFKLHKSNLFFYRYCEQVNKFNKVEINFYLKK